MSSHLLSEMPIRNLQHEAANLHWILSSLYELVNAIKFQATEMYVSLDRARQQR
jgi:hypothetical protein